MQNNPIPKPPIRKCTMFAAERYCAVLLESASCEYPLPNMIVRLSCSPCGKYLLAGMFRHGLEPGSHSDIWERNPASASEAFIALVGGSDIFVMKPNLNGCWSKFSARRDAAVLTNILFDEQEIKWNTIVRNLPQ